MHLQRVKIPKFRALENVDITFEHEFIPRVFPLGSQNGGGKSTLLQLIFVLLHCSSDPERLPYLRNMLAFFQIRPDISSQTLVELEVLDGETMLQIEFLAAKDSFLHEGMGIAESDRSDYKFTISTQLASKREQLNKLLEKQKNLLAGGDKQQATNVRLKIKELREEESKFLIRVTEVEEFLKSQGLILISTKRFSKEGVWLLCRIQGIDDVNRGKSFLGQLAEKVFLVSPSTQIYLFLTNEERKLFFKQEGYVEYQTVLGGARTKLPGFSTYDSFSIASIIEFFQQARNKDFTHKIETGVYGDNYDNLLANISTWLGNKHLSPLPDLSGVTFKLPNSDTEIFPEDLSHGEMKRLVIYSWLKANQIEDAIVLMDEIEIALHPDWQIQIVRDLLEWAGSNQYILATHSLELCQAVTPAHVKEIPPRLRPQG